MTVSSATSQVKTLGDGVTRVFPIPFYFLENGHIQVSVTDSVGVDYPVTPNIDYVVAGAGNQSGGTVTFNTAPISLRQVIILRNVPATQTSDYQPNDDFPAETLERSLDKLTMLVQQLFDGLDLAVTVPLGQTPPNISDIQKAEDYALAALAAAAQAALYAQYAKNDWIINGPYLGTGTDTNYPLSVNPGSANNLFVFAGGVSQLVSQTAYTLVYDGANNPFIRINLPLNVPFEVRTGNAVPIATPAVGAVHLASLDAPLQSSIAKAEAAAPAASPILTGDPKSVTPPVGDNDTSIATTAFVQSAIANKNAWTGYTPTLTASSGTYTTASATGKYMVALGICYFQATITVATKGTGGNPILTLPFAALAGSANMPIPARETLVSGKLSAAVILSGLTTALIVGYDNSDIAVNGSSININGSYPIA